MFKAKSVFYREYCVEVSRAQSFQPFKRKQELFKNTALPQGQLAQSNDLRSFSAGKYSLEPYI